MSRDMRKFARESSVRAMIYFILILFVVGDGLIWVFYGWQNAISGALCMLAGLIPIGLVFLILQGIDFLVKRNKDD